MLGLFEFFSMALDASSNLVESAMDVDNCSLVILMGKSELRI